MYSKVAKNAALNWDASPERALFDIQRCVHAVAGCPVIMMPRTLQEAEDLSNACSMGRWYTEDTEPIFGVMSDTWVLIRTVALEIISSDRLESPGIKAAINFLCRASCWALVSGRQAAIYLSLQLITGLGDAQVDFYDSRFLKRRQLSLEIIDRCCLSNIQLDTVHGEPYYPSTLQIRDRVIGTRESIAAAVRSWLKMNPELYFPICYKLLVLLVSDRVGKIALLGIQILIDLVPRFDEADGNFIVTFAFMNEVKDALSSRILYAKPSNQISVVAKMAIVHFVNSRVSNGESGRSMDEWKDIAKTLCE